METPQSGPLVNWELNSSQTNDYTWISFFTSVVQSLGKQRYIKSCWNFWESAKPNFYTAPRLRHPKKAKVENVKPNSIIIPTKNCIKLCKNTKQNPLAKSWSTPFPFRFHSPCSKIKGNGSPLVSYWSVAHFEARDPFLSSPNVPSHLQRGVCLLLVSSLDFL